MGYWTSIFAVVAAFTFHFAALFEEEVFLSDEGKLDFSLVVDDQKNYSLFDVQAKLLKQYVTKSGYKIGIYDDILTTSQRQMLRALTTYKLGSWSYRILELDVHGGQKKISLNNIPWSNELNAVEFSQSIVGKHLQKVVMDMFGGGEDQYAPYKVVGHIIRCGDSPKVHVDARPDEEEVSLVIYLNEKWRKNDYGDLYLYDENIEILAGVVPRYGRVVMWHSSIPYLPRPPSVAYKLGQLFLHIRYTKNHTKLNNAHKRWLGDKKLHEAIQKDGFFLTSEDGSNDIGGLDVETKFTSEAKSKKGKRIVVFDGLFLREVLDHLRSVILNYGVYYYDDSYDEESDNVQWIAGFDVDKYVQSRMWRITQKVARFVSGGHPDWFPYDVSCNLIRNADATQIHYDCSYDEDEWTFLLYLNPNWSINDYGETVFYESSDDDDNEIITEVLPKYGRVVIFQGIIPHSARPPSRNFTGARLSFAVKLSKNEWIGRRKAFEEEMRHLHAVSSMLQLIKERYFEGNEGGEDPVAAENNFQPPDYDSQLQEMEERLGSLSYDEKGLEKLRSLCKEVRSSHLEAREQIGEFLRAML